MIVPKSMPTNDAIASHYNDLDSFYRDTWGEHVHHGLWHRGNEPPEVAVKQLVELVVQYAELKRGDSVCDIGCGYGATAHMLVSDLGANVTGLTLSSAQVEFAQQRAGTDSRQKYLLRDWLDNGLPSDSFDVAISIESSDHMQDKRRFLAEALRVLKPGGRFVMTAWLSCEAPRDWEIHHLLEPICREGRIPGLGTASEYRKWMREEGFDVIGYEDLSQKVQKTWALAIAEGIKTVATSQKHLRFALSPENPNRVFLLTMLRMWIAYKTKSMCYGIIAARKPEKRA
jgi:tocopherol O-methyltransferase